MADTELVQHLAQMKKKNIHNLASFKQNDIPSQLLQLIDVHTSVYVVVFQLP